MPGQSSRFERAIALGAAGAALAIGAVAATGCGDDAEVEIDGTVPKSVKEQAQSVRSEAEEKAESAQEKAESVAKEAEQEAKDQADGY